MNYQATLQGRFQDEIKKLDSGLNTKLPTMDFDAYKKLVDAALGHLKRRMEW